MRKSKLDSAELSSLVISSGLRATGSLPASAYRGRSSSGSYRLRTRSPVGLVPGDSARKVCRFVSLHANRVPGRASASNIGKFKSTGIPQLTMGSTRTPVSSAAAKPGELSGGAG